MFSRISPTINLCSQPIPCLSTTANIGLNASNSQIPKVQVLFALCTEYRQLKCPSTSHLKMYQTKSFPVLKTPQTFSELNPFHFTNSRLLPPHCALCFFGPANHASLFLPPASAVTSTCFKGNDRDCTSLTRV